MISRFLGNVIPGLLVLVIVASGCASTKAMTLGSMTPNDTVTLSATLSPVSTSTPVEPTQTQTPFRAPVPLPFDPFNYEVSYEFKEGTSKEEISRALLSLWLDHLMSPNIDPHFRLESSKITQYYYDPYPVCTLEPGEVFLLVGGVEIETTFPLLCGNTRCDQSAWAAGGGEIIDSSHEYWAFGGPVFKSGNIYTLKIINAAPPC